MRWFCGLIAGCLLLALPACVKQVTSHIIVAGDVESYVPANGGTVTWETYGDPFQIYWVLGPPLCTPKPSTSADGKIKMVSCEAPKTTAPNNIYTYTIGPPGAAPALVQSQVHMMRIGPCNNCDVVTPGGFGSRSPTGSDGNLLGCSSNVPVVVPPVISAAKSSKVSWTVVGNDYSATITFNDPSACVGTLTGNKLSCSASAAAGDYQYTVPALTQCGSNSPTPFTLHVNQ